MTYSPSIIDLSRIPVPDAITSFTSEEFIAQFIQRFQTAWDAARVKNPALPVWDVSPLEVDPVQIVGQAWSWLRLLDRQAVNDAVRGVLAPSAKGSNLDNIAARVNVQRLVIEPATDLTPVVMESDASVLRRYLLAFDRPSAGSIDRYLYEAWTAWPKMGDCKINGRAIHGRRGDTDVVIAGPGGRVPSAAEIKLVRDAVTADNVRPEAVSVSAIPATRAPYSVKLLLDIPLGPDPEVVREEVRKRVLLAASARTFIGGMIPDNYFGGIAYGLSVIDVKDLNPVAIPSMPYVIPVCEQVEILLVKDGA